MDYNFEEIVDYADRHEQEEMLEYLMEKITGNGMLGAMKAKVFIENMEKYSLGELEKRLK